MAGAWVVCYEDRGCEEGANPCLIIVPARELVIVPQARTPSITRCIDSPFECISILWLLSTASLPPRAFFLRFVTWLNPVGLSLKVTPSEKSFNLPV